MWSSIVHRVTLCVLYVLLAYCDVIVLSQKLRMYDSSHTERASGHATSESRKLSETVMRSGATQRPTIIHSTRASDDTKYIHGMTYLEHKEFDKVEREKQHRQNAASNGIQKDGDKQSSASEQRGQFSHYRFRPLDPPHVPSWRMATVDPWPHTVSASAADEITTVSPYSYFSTTSKPRLDSWRRKYSPVEPYRPTIRAISEIKSPFGRTIVQTSLRAQNPCCQNDTEGDVATSSPQGKGRIRYYHSFSRERGYAPHRAMKLITTATTQRPTQLSINALDVRSNSRFRNVANRFGLGQAGNVIGGLGDEIGEATWTTARPFDRTTTWVPQTTKDRIYETQHRRNSTRIIQHWNSTRAFDVIPPRYIFGGPPRSGFDGTHERTHWDTKKAQTPPTTTTTTKRPSSRDEYDYYDDLEEKLKATRIPHIAPRLTTTNASNNAPWNSYNAIKYDDRSKSKSIANIDVIWNRNLHQITTTTTKVPTRRRPFTSHPSTSKAYGENNNNNNGDDDDDDFKKWKVSIEQTVQRLRRPSNRGRASAYRSLSGSSPTLENDIAPLLKVSGVEEEDWKYVHETNRGELSKRRRPAGASWRSGQVELNSRTPLDPAINELRFPRPRRTTTTTSTTSTTPKPVYDTTRTTWGPLFSTTRRAHVPRRRISTRVRRPSLRGHLHATGDAVTGPRYRHRVYTPPAGLIVSDIPDTTGATVKATTADRQSTSSVSFKMNTTAKPVGTESPSLVATQRKVDTAISRTTMPTISRPSSAVPHDAWNGRNMFSYTTPYVHWLTTTTRRPVYGDGMSIEQQLAEALRRLQERNARKQQEQRERNERLQRETDQLKAELISNDLTKHQLQSVNDVEGSGSWDRMIADEPTLVIPLEGIPEVADVHLEGDVQIREEVQQTLTEQIEDGAIFGELLDEHIIKIGDPKEHSKHSRLKKNKNVQDNNRHVSN